MDTPDSTIVPRLIARYRARLIARARPQDAHRLSPCRGRHGTHGTEGQQLGAIQPLDPQDVARQRLPRYQRAQVAGKVVGLGRAARLAVQVPEVELPAARLVAAVLAHQAVQPALDPAREAEVRRVDRKSTRLNSSHANISYAVFCLKKKTS